MKQLIAIIGPTAVGKSQFAIQLAQEYHGEIVSADSRQIYRYLNIGTAKPTSEEISLVPHHLIDIVNPDEDFSLSQYQKLAYQTINDIQKREKLAVLVGGSGLYVWAMLEGWQIPHVPPDLALRHSLAEKAAREGITELHQELVSIDPVAAQRIEPLNVRRVIRALEVCQSTGQPFSRLQQKKLPAFDTLIVGLTVERKELYHRIDARVNRMIEQGLVEEVKKLVSMGYDFHFPAMSGIGYKQIGMFLRGELTLEAAIQQIKFETHRFARHQYNWFRLTDKRIKWFDIQGEIEPEIKVQVAGFIKSE
jgi:tRNA dimethylallyltransferase